jgi:hypothetical protein
MKERARKIFDLFHDPKFLTKFHGWSTIAWFLLAFPICIWLSESIPLLVFISVYALVTSHWSAWQASRVEENQSKEIEEVDEDVEQHRDATEG